MSPSHLVWKACLTALHIIAVFSTLLRIVHRYRIHRLWWDDYVTIIPLVAECFYVSSVWIRYSDSKLDKSLIMWLSVLPFITVLWTSRLSLALGMVRIYPPNGWRARQCAIAIAVGCGLMWIGSTTQVLVSCLPETLKGCTTKGLPKHTAYLGSSADVLIDLLLVAIPLYYLRSIDLPTAQRRLIKVAFSASIVTLLSALNLIFFLFIGYGKTSSERSRMIFYMVNIEAATSLIVSNALVLITWFYRICHRADVEGEITTTRISVPGPTRAATTVVFTEISEFHYTEFSAEEYIHNDSETSEKLSTHVAPSLTRQSAES